MTVTALKCVMTGAGSPCASELWESEADNYHSLLGMYLHSGRLPEGWTEFSFCCRIGSVLGPIIKKISKADFSISPLLCLCLASFGRLRQRLWTLLFEFSCSLWNSGLITQTVCDGNLVTYWNEAT